MEIAKKEDNTMIWEQHMRSWAVSRISQKAYCKRHALSFHSFQYWRKRLMHIEPAQPLKVVQVAESKGLPQIVNPSRQLTSTPIRFWVGGYRIEIADNFNPESLSQLVHVLQTL